VTEGKWTTGRHSKEEWELLTNLIKIATGLATKGKLPWHYSSPKITFRAWKDGTTLHVYYAWNYPPKESWSKETKTERECVKCLPRGIKGDAAREVWCEHTDYKFTKCPYGVPTIPRPVLKVLVGDING